MSPRRVFACCLILAWPVALAGPLAVPIPLGEGGGGWTIEREPAGLLLHLSLDTLWCTETATPEGPMVILRAPHCVPSREVGKPMLPVWRRLVAVPLGASVETEAIRWASTDIALADWGIHFPVFPAQPPVPKRGDPPPFAKDGGAYRTPGLAAAPRVAAEELGMLRGVRLFLISVQPFSYDPTAGVVRAWHEVDIRLRFLGGDIRGTAAWREATWSPYFEFLSQAMVINHEPVSRLDDLTRYPVSYLIVAHPTFAAQLEPLVAWKRKKGFDVSVGYVGQDMGATPTAIKQFVRSHFENATPQHPAPSFLLLVGDVAQVPTWSGLTGTHPTDLHYATIVGDDFMPDLMVGRFSASSANELQPQIDKTLEYEQYLMPDPSYLAHAVMVAGMDPTFAQVWANGQIRYGTTYYFNQDHGIVSHTYLYPSSGSAASEIIGYVSQGTCFANYTAHGWEGGWADPPFAISDINTLQNHHKYGTVIGNACLTNRFDVPTCFGEAWLRAPGKGAVGYVGASNSSFWDEDFWWAVGAGSISPNPTYEATGPGAYDGMFHDHGEPFSQWFTTQYAFVVAGCLAVAQAGSPERDYYWEIYCLMGDPSVATWFGIPSPNSAHCPDHAVVGQAALTVAAEPWSYVGLSRAGSLLAAGLVGETGQVTLSFDPLSSVGQLEVVVTRQNRIPFTKTIQVLPAEGPWVITEHVAVEDPEGNANGWLDHGEEAFLSLTERNVGVDDAEEVVVRVRSNDPRCTVVDSVEAYGTIPAQESVAIPRGFRVRVSPECPHGASLSFTTMASDAQGHVWQDGFTLTVLAPVLSVQGVSVEDGNGILDPGETSALRVRVGNVGGTDAFGVRASLMAHDVVVTVVSPDQSLGTVPAGSWREAVFLVSASPTCPPGYQAGFSLRLVAQNYAVTESFTLSVGRVVEDFESGDFSTFPWVMQGNSPWVIDTQVVYEGTHAAASGRIGHSQVSTMLLGVNVVQPGELAFFYRVSSEAGYDFLRFSVDGTTLLEASGNVGWTRASFPLSSGSHTLVWSYQKDYSVSQGADRAWVDLITFPCLADTAQFPHIQVSPCSLDFAAGSAPQVAQLIVSNTGNADLVYRATVSAGATKRPVKGVKGAGSREVGPRVDKGSGGPDGHGYRWEDSDEPDGPRFSWRDIGSQGSVLGTGDDATWGPIPLGFSFPFYGSWYDSVRVCSNGWLSFTSASTSFEHQDIPCPNPPNALIAPLWMDLDPSSGGRVLCGHEAGLFVVQWDGVPPYSPGPPPGAYTFQVVLASDGTILFQYLALTGPTTECAVGIEDEVGLDGLCVAFDQPYLHDSLAVRFEPGNPWLVVSPSEGVVAPGGWQAVEVRCDPTGLSPGVYQARILIHSNDPLQPVMPVGVQLTVVPVAVQDPLPVAWAIRPVPNPFWRVCTFSSPAGHWPDEVSILSLKGDLVWRWTSACGTPPTWCPAPGVAPGAYVARVSVGRHIAPHMVVYLKDWRAH